VTRCPIVKRATMDKPVQCFFENLNGHGAAAQLVNLHPVLSRGARTTFRPLSGGAHGSFTTMAHGERPDINFMLLGPLALTNATTNRSSMSTLACEAADIMLIVASLMQMRDVKSHGEPSE